MRLNETWEVRSFKMLKGYPVHLDEAQGAHEKVDVTDNLGCECVEQTGSDTDRMNIFHKLLCPAVIFTHTQIQMQTHDWTDAFKCLFQVFIHCSG